MALAFIERAACFSPPLPTPSKIRRVWGTPPDPRYGAAAPFTLARRDSTDRRKIERTELKLPPYVRDNVAAAAPMGRCSNVFPVPAKLTVLWRTDDNRTRRPAIR